MNQYSSDMMLAEYDIECASYACESIMIDMALEREIVVIEGLPEIIRELKAIGNNLNQLTILAHQGKIRTMNFRNFTEQVADIYVEICDLAKRIS